MSVTPWGLPEGLRSTGIVNDGWPVQFMEMISPSTNDGAAMASMPPVQVRNCRALRPLLSLLLALGNHMNGGTAKGQADGFALEARAAA